MMRDKLAVSQPCVLQSDQELVMASECRGAGNHAACTRTAPELQTRKRSRCRLQGHTLPLHQRVAEGNVRSIMGDDRMAMQHSRAMSTYILLIPGNKVGGYPIPILKCSSWLS